MKPHVSLKNYPEKLLVCSCMCNIQEINHVSLFMNSLLVKISIIEKLTRPQFQLIVYICVYRASN